MNLGETSRPSCGSHDTGRAGRAARFGIALLLLASPAAADSHIDCSVEGACCFPYSASYNAPRMERVSDPRRATIAAITVGDGALAKPAVKRVLGNRSAVLGACTSGQGQVTAHLLVAPSGATQIMRITGSLAACAAEALRTTKFPVTTGVTEVDVRITW